MKIFFGEPTSFCNIADEWARDVTTRRLVEFSGAAAHNLASMLGMLQFTNDNGRNLGIDIACPFKDVSKRGALAFIKIIFRDSRVGNSLVFRSVDICWSATMCDHN